MTGEQASLEIYKLWTKSREEPQMVKGLGYSYEGLSKHEAYVVFTKEELVKILSEARLMGRFEHSLGIKLELPACMEECRPTVEAILNSVEDQK